MADKKISALTSLAQGDVAASTDVLPIVDTSATETKKITASALVGAGMTAGVTNVDINSGSIDGTTIGANSAAAGTFTNLTASGTVSFSGATVSNGGAVTTIDINGGTIDATSIGASSASTGTFTTLTTSSTVTLNGGTANGVLYLNGSKVATSGSTIVFDGSNLGVGVNTLFTRASIAASNSATSVGTQYNPGILNIQNSDTTNGNLSLIGFQDASSFVNLAAIGAVNTTHSGSPNSVVGQLAFYTKASGGGYVTEKMRIDSSGNVGIGTSSPATLLDVRDGVGSILTLGNTGTFVAGESSYLKFRESNTALADIGWEADTNEVRINNRIAGPMTFYTSNSEKMRLDSSGNLGLGVTPSAWSGTKAIDVGQVGTGVSGSAGNGNLTQGAYNDGSWKRSQASYAVNLFNASNGAYYWFQAASGATDSAISWTQAMTLDASGRLLVGLTSSSNGGALQVDANGSGSTVYTGLIRNSNTSTSAYNVVQFTQGASGSATGVIGTGGSATGNTAFANNFVVGTQTSNAFVFVTNDAERARITAGGEFGINETNPSAYNTRFISTSTANNKFAGVFYNNASSNDGQAALQVSKSSNTNTSSQVFVDFIIDAFNTGSGRISANGASAAAFASYSDARLKENIVELPSQLENICALRPVEFDYKNGSGHQIGFIAQEMQEVYPDVIAEGDNGMLTLTGWSKTEARLVKAIQEQQAMIKSLEAKVAALESK